MHTEYKVKLKHTLFAGRSQPIDSCLTNLRWNMDEHNKRLLIIIALILYYIKSKKRMQRKRKRDNTSVMTGHQYTMELKANNLQCIELLRMSRDAYILLCAHFKTKGWLKDNNSISVEEKMAIFLMIIGHNQRFRMVKRRFQHSLQTIYAIFHEVLEKMQLFANEIIVPTSFNPNPNVPGSNKRLRRIFKGAIGALDGTLVHAIVPANGQQSYRGRGRGDCYQNVLAICDFNMIFTFVVAGWEGTAHDAKVLAESILNPDMNFPVPPPGKYYLCDAAYRNTRGFMALYRNVRYWLGDYRRTRAANKYEKFNHAQAKLRNVIERAYGVLKARFPILKRMPPFKLEVQRDVVLSCFAVHNFIRKEGLIDEFFEYDQVDGENGDAQEDNENEVAQEYQAHGSAADQQYMNDLREQISNRV